jgi:ABC-type transporter Mla MlaB component
MTVRINKAGENSKSIVTVAGRLDRPVVRELLKACHSIDGEFVLDLAGLLSADSAGIEAIHSLVRGGAKLRGASPFIRLLLDDQPPMDAD